MTFTKICTDFFLNQLDSAEYLHSLLQIINDLKYNKISHRFFLQNNYLSGAAL
jgi:hypothetical protein